MFKNKPSYTGFLEGVLIGGSLGAAATFLLGTEEGKKMRQGLKQKYKAFEKKAKRYSNDVKKAINSPVAKKLKRLAKKAGVKSANSPVAKKLKRVAKRAKTISRKASAKVVRKMTHKAHR